MGPTDSHTDILERHGLKDVVRGEMAIVKFEILPPGGDSTKPLEDWTVIVDQDILPDWFVPEVDKARALDALRRSGVVPLYADYEAKRAPLEADYRAKCAPLYADYRAKRDALYADCEAKRAPLVADYRAKRAPLEADYEAKCDALYADYRAKRDALTKGPL